MTLKYQPQYVCLKYILSAILFFTTSTANAGLFDKIFGLYDSQQTVNLCQAIRKNQISRINKILESSPHLAFSVEENRGCWPPLHEAARMDNTEAFKILRKHINNFDFKNSLGFTALHAAVGINKYSKSHYDMVSTLIKAGANVNSQDNEGKTPLTWAIRVDNKEAVNILMKNGGKQISRVAHAAVYELHRAAEMGKTSDIVKLISNGADPNERINTNQLNPVEPLDINSPRKGIRIYNCFTPLHVAANSSVAEALLKNGADVNAKASISKEGSTTLVVTPLDIASMGKNESLISIIKKHGGSNGEGNNWKTVSCKDDGVLVTK